MVTPSAANPDLATNREVAVNVADGSVPPVWLVRVSEMERTRAGFLCARNREVGRFESLRLVKKLGGVDTDR